MAAITKVHLSGGTTGTPILINATTSGTAVTLHTATGTTDVMDEIVLYAANKGTAQISFTLMIDSLQIPMPIPPAIGLIEICPGLILGGSKVVKGFNASDTTNLYIAGWVNRIDQT